MELILLPKKSENLSLDGIYHRALSRSKELYIVSAYLTEWGIKESLGDQCESFLFIVGKDFGITSQSDLVRRAALGMATQSKVDMLPPNPADVSRASMMGGFSGAGQVGGQGAQAAPTFHFSPQINVPGGSDVREQVTQGLQAGYAEFVKNMDRYFHDKRRRSYGSPDEGFA